MPVPTPSTSTNPGTRTALTCSPSLAPGSPARRSLPKPGRHLVLQMLRAVRQVREILIGLVDQLLRSVAVTTFFVLPFHDYFIGTR
jgi:hypothetical protein